MKLDVIDFARRVGVSVDEANKWLDKNATEADVLFDIAFVDGYNFGFEEGAKESDE